ncbi:unnamed protein product [Lathyrus sativus]|nr:unnamed protein product [Lathyrus sativus]
MWTFATLRLVQLEKVTTQRFGNQIGLEISHLKVGFCGCSRKISSVNEMGSWEDGHWVWKVRESLIDDGINFVSDWADCSGLLDQMAAISSVGDNWKWLLHDSLSYKVRSFYAALPSSSSASAHTVGNDCAALLEILWKTVLPAKVQIFIWRLALDMLPTISNLMKIRVIDYSQNSDCAFCSSSIEDVSHLFFSCSKSSLVWNRICEWVDIEYISEDCCSLHAKVWKSRLPGHCKEYKINSIWFISCWSLWRARNNIIFNNASIDIEDIVFDIKVFSWNWLILGRQDNKNCNLYDWFKFPFDFM